MEIFDHTISELNVRSLPIRVVEERRLCITCKFQLVAAL